MIEIPSYSSDVIYNHHLHYKVKGLDVYAFVKSNHAKQMFLVPAIVTSKHKGMVIWYRNMTNAVDLL